MWILLGWCLTVKNWWCHLSQHLGINATNYFMYDGRGQCAPPPLRAPASQPSRCTKSHQLPD